MAQGTPAGHCSNVILALAAPTVALKNCTKNQLGCKPSCVPGKDALGNDNALTHRLCRFCKCRTCKQCQAGAAPADLGMTVLQHPGQHPAVERAAKKTTRTLLRKKKSPAKKKKSAAGSKQRDVGSKQQAAGSKKRRTTRASGRRRPRRTAARVEANATSTTRAAAGALVAAAAADASSHRGGSAGVSVRARDSTPSPAAEAHAHEHGTGGHHSSSTIEPMAELIGQVLLCIALAGSALACAFMLFKAYASRGEGLAAAAAGYDALAGGPETPR